MTWNDLVALGLELPEVELGTWYGTPALKVRKKGFVRLEESWRQKAPKTLVAKLDASRRAR